MERRHRMPFGAQPVTGGIRFRLWAPDAHRVQLAVEDREDIPPIDMQPAPDGWFAITTDQAGIGSLYRFRVDDGPWIPDPASRFQPRDVHGPSQVVDPAGWQWTDNGWQGRPWNEAIIYELHVGTFTPEGTLAAAEPHLPELAELGITAVELMPVADFPGDHDWGYNGACLFAPDSRYGTPEELKSFIQAAHGQGLMVLLDVVYNHFGPEGNYLHLSAPRFFTRRHQTPWGDAINFDGPESHWVRQFFIHNALYWLEEYHFDGLRLDAVHAIQDNSQPDILTELADTVHARTPPHRHVHLVLENDDNAAHYLARDRDGNPRWFVAQWNDDLHHALHVTITGETRGYYTDYRDNPVAHLGRCLTEGFAYQGESSEFRNDTPRGEPSAQLPPVAFVGFLQNHDQVGNRPFGDRIQSLAAPDAIRAALAIVLLAPSPPLIFMGQEWLAPEPFPFFCDFGEDLAEAVTEGRRREFAQYPEFGDPEARHRIPDPMDPTTHRKAVLDWSRRKAPGHREWLDLHQRLLAIRHQAILPLLAGLRGNEARYTLLGDRSLQASWRLAGGHRLTLIAHLDDDPGPRIEPPPGRILYTTNRETTFPLPPWSVDWYLAKAETPPAQNRNPP